MTRGIAGSGSSRDEAIYRNLYAAIVENHLEPGAARREKLHGALPSLVLREEAIDGRRSALRATRRFRTIVVIEIARAKDCASHTTLLGSRDELTATRHLAAHQR